MNLSAFSQSSFLVMSSFTKAARVFEVPASSSATFVPELTSISARRTFAPSSMKRLEIAFPKPEDAPVTRAF